MTLAALLRRERRALAFGLLHTIAATVGQTFLISLFLPGIKESLVLGDAQIALLFTVTTLASGAALWKVGAWIDRSDVVRYSVGCGLLLALSCLAIAVSTGVVMLVIGMFCLRLAGNGLLTHIALTATARYFTSRRGQALSIVLLGSSVGEASLPAVIVALIGVSGWRLTLGVLGCARLALVLTAAWLISKQHVFRRPHSRATDVSGASVAAGERRRPPGGRRYFLITAPLFIAMPMIVTATIFHQALIARAKGVSLEWFAVSFIAFAIARVASSVATGPAADRFGSTALFSAHLVPLAVGTAALITLSDRAAVPFYWFCAGVTSGMGGVLQNTVIAERVSLAQLGRARSVLAAVTIVASAAGPSVYGLGLTLGAGMPTILWASVGVLIAATGFGVLGSTAGVRSAVS